MDVTAEAVARPGLLTQAAEVILTDPNVDNLVMFFGIVPGAHERLATGIAQVAQGTDKLVVMTWFPLPRRGYLDEPGPSRRPGFPGAGTGDTSARQNGSVRGGA